MGIILEIILGGRTGFRTEFEQERITIGRESAPGNKTNDVDFDHYSDITASRNHAVIEKSGLGYILEELNGKGNTFVNGTAVTRKILRNNDIIQFGSGGPEIRVMIPEDPSLVRARNLPPGGLKTVYEERRKVGRKTLLEVVGLHNVKLENRISSATKKATTAVIFTLILGIVISYAIYSGIKYYKKLERTDLMITSCIEESELRLSEKIAELRDKGELTDQRISGLRAEYAILKKTLPSMSTIISDLRRSVVKIKTVYDITESGSEKSVVYRGKPCRFSIQGSGFCIREDGYILTNAHIISPWLFNTELADKGFSGKERLLTVTFDGESRPRNAEIKALDKNSDLALIKIEGNGFHVMKTGSFSPSAGDSVAILGFPSAVSDVSSEVYCTVIGGNISRVEPDGMVLYSMITGNGNSGGPLITQNGRLAGLHVSGLLYDGISYYVRQGAEEMLSMSDLDNGDLTGTIEIDDLDLIFKRKEGVRTDSISRGITSTRIMEFLTKHL